MREGTVRAVGVSNFNLDQMVQLLGVAAQGDVKPTVLQSNSGEGVSGEGWGWLLDGMASFPTDASPPCPFYVSPQTCCTRTGSCRRSAGSTASSSKHTAAWVDSGRLNIRWADAG